MSSDDSLPKLLLRGCGWVVLWVLFVFVVVPVVIGVVFIGPVALGSWLVDEHPDQAIYLAYPALAWVPFGALVAWQKFQEGRAERQAEQRAELYRAAQHRKVRLSGTDAPETDSPDPVDLEHAALPERSCEVCRRLADQAR